MTKIFSGRILAGMTLLALVVVALYFVGSVTRTISDTQDNMETYVRNSNGNYFEATEAGIQAALDDIDKPKTGEGYQGGIVWVPGKKSINIYNGIRMANYSTLNLQGSVLMVREDVDVVTMAYGSHLRNGRIHMYYAPSPFTKSAILFDGEPIFWSQATVQDMRLVSYDQEGIGIHYRADSNGEIIAFTLCNNIETHGFEYGLLLNCSGGTSSKISYINGNIFTNFVSIYDKYSVYLDRNTAEGYNYATVDGNTFNNFQVQPGAPTESCIRAIGRYNQFSNIFLWDWHAAGGANAYHLTSDTQYTYLQFFGGGDDLLDEGFSNTAYDTGRSNLDIKGFLSTDNEIKGKIYSQTSEPNIEDDSFAFWHKTSTNEHYLILDRAGTQVKTELT
ncbi:hypothetical protein K8R43_05240 [archaeon]|nr:hypothetical protein [archaeon]